MKVNKVVIGLMIVLTMVLVPRISASKENKTDSVTLTDDNLLVLNSEVSGESVGAIIQKAKELDAKLSGRLGISKQPIYLFLNTPGGSIQAGLEMIEALNGLGRKVNTITLFAASMGFQTVQNLGDRLILKNGVLMSHHAAGEIQGSFGGVHPSQMDNRYELWLDRIKELDEQTVKRTNGKQTYESYLTQYDKEMWLTGTKSVAQGYADRIVSIKCDKSLSGTTKHKADFLGFTINYELDKCPLNTAPLNIGVGMTAGMTQEYANHIKNQFLSNFEMKAVNPLPLSF